MQTSLSRQIMVPLSVMVLLTVLIGLSMMQLLKPWDHAVKSVNQHFTEVVILNQIRSDLDLLNQDLNFDNRTEQDLMLRWIAIKEKVNTYNQIAPSDTVVLPELVFDNRDHAKNTVNALLQRDYFRQKLQQMQAELGDLLEYTRFVTLLMTLSMVVLGVVLMGVTANRLNQLIEQLKQSRDLNMRIQEEERRRIAQDLHDSVVQDMVDLKRQYQPEKADALIDNVRRICHNLKPQVLHDLGLMSALAFLVEELESVEGIEAVHLQTEDVRLLDSLSKEIELSIFRVLQESFANIRRHANASQVWVMIKLKQHNGTWIEAEIKDNGTGFDCNKTENGMGLTGIRERVEQLGGRCTIESTIGSGTQIHFSVPLG